VRGDDGHPEKDKKRLWILGGHLGNRKERREVTKKVLCAEEKAPIPLLNSGEKGKGSDKKEEAGAPP